MQPSQQGDCLNSGQGVAAAVASGVARVAGAPIRELKIFGEGTNIAVSKFNVTYLID